MSGCWLFRLPLAALCSAALLAQAAGTGTVRGIAHDPQHRPVDRVKVTVRCPGPSWSGGAISDRNGEFEIAAVPEGVCSVTAEAAGFETAREQVSVAAGKVPVLHMQLSLAQVAQSLEVSGAASRLATQTSTVGTSLASRELERTPGADQTNSMAMITDYVPGAYMIHDMLHIRGGHQVNWFLDGIPVLNTSIASNIAPLVNPKNIAELEVERGGYSSQYGDRTYGFFNVVTPSGFERDKEAELVASYGNFHSTDDHLSFGSHTERFAYYAGIDANRSDLGLSTPVPLVIHDRESGVGGFLSLLYNPAPKDQLRWIASLRRDDYQIPNTPAQQDAGIRDVQFERDSLAGMRWTHTLSNAVLFSVSPYYHFNSARYAGGPADTPFVLQDDNRSNYLGVRSALQAQGRKHAVRLGIDAWGEHADAAFGLTANPGTQALRQELRHWATSAAAFLEDRYQPVSWLTLDLGLRVTRYGGLIAETAADPRLGAAVRLPFVNWTLHGYYSSCYQPPPLDSLAGPLLEFALAEGYAFVPLAGERDIQKGVGLTVPVRGWSLDIDWFHTSARNFLDHDVIGNSGIFIPLTDLAAIIRGTEIAVRSPLLFRAARLHVAWSNQIAEGVGPVTGGLLQFAPAESFLLDHDQRNTLSAVLSLTLPGRVWATPAYHFGSGFLDGNGPAHLPPNSTFDLGIGKDFGESWSLSVNAVNLANSRYLLDNSNTFGGTHYIDPRRLYAEMRYRFHY